MRQRLSPSRTTRSEACACPRALAPACEECAWAGAANYDKANKNPGEKNAESEGLCVVLALGTPGRAAGAALVEDQERSLNLDCGRSVAVGA